MNASSSSPFMKSLFLLASTGLLLPGCAADRVVRAKLVVVGGGLLDPADVQGPLIDHDTLIAGYIVDEGNGAFAAVKHVTCARPVTLNHLDQCEATGTGDTNSKTAQIGGILYDVGAVGMGVGAGMYGGAAIAGKLRPSVNVRQGSVSGGSVNAYGGRGGNVYPTQTQTQSYNTTPQGTPPPVATPRATVPLDAAGYPEVPQAPVTPTPLTATPR